MKMTEFEKLERQHKILAEQKADKPKRELIGVEISDDYGETWKLRVLCDTCARSIEPPLQRHRLGVAMSKNCDWCGARNIN
jgi:hypothetical protein